MDKPKEYFEVELNIKLSKNFNSAGCNVKYGREAKAGESREKLAEDVKQFVEKELNKVVVKIDKLL